jgi:hypothetical protein
VDGATNSVVGTVRTSGEPLALFHNRLNDKVYYAWGWMDSILVISGRTNAVVGNVYAGPGVTAFAWSESLNTTYVTNQFDSRVGVLRDSLTGIGDGSSTQHVTCTESNPTIVRGMLVFGAVHSREHSACRAELLDISGRRVFDLHPGANDVRHLAPGVYFVREAQAKAQAQAIHKVILTE